MRTARRQHNRHRATATPTPRVPPMPFTPFSTAWMMAEAARWPELEDECPCCVDRAAQFDDDDHYRTVYPDLYASDDDRHYDGDHWEDDYYDTWYATYDEPYDRHPDDVERDALCNAFASYDRYVDEQTAWFEAFYMAEDAAQAAAVAPVPPVRQLARSGVVAGKVRLDPQKGAAHRALAKRGRHRAQRRAARWAVVESAAVG